MKVSIIDTGSANLNSVRQALKRLGCDPVVSSDPQELASSDRLIFPGVGAAEAVMRGIEKRKLRDFILGTKIPLLGICLGMQVLGLDSEETDLENSGVTKTLGIVPGHVLKLDARGGRLPHMGWNTVKHGDHPLFQGIRDEAYFYFDHSYAMQLGAYTIGETSYGCAFTSALAQGSFMGVQFHPEKSGAEGARLLQNFLDNF
jgi:glutamine amidotransferase